jgi:hypothetical protein
MTTPFLDFINGQDFQRAVLDTRQRQEANYLAVQPAVDLRGSVSSALRRYGVGTRLAIADRRLGLAKDAARFERKQSPYAIGIAAAGAGLGGIQYLYAQQAGRIEGIRLAGLQEQRKQTGVLTDILKDRTRAAEESLPNSRPTSLPRLDAPNFNQVDF